MQLLSCSLEKHVSSRRVITNLALQARNLRTARKIDQLKPFLPRIRGPVLLRPDCDESTYALVITPFGHLLPFERDVQALAQYFMELTLVLSKLNEAGFARGHIILQLP